MIGSLLEFRERKLRNLHARRLESLCANYTEGGVRSDIRKQRD